MTKLTLLLTLVLGLSGCATSLNGGLSDELVEESADAVYTENTLPPDNSILNLPPDATCQQYQGVVCIVPAVEQIGAASGVVQDPTQVR